MKSPTMLDTRYWLVPVRSKLNGSKETASLDALKASGGKKRAMLIQSSDI
jgi:hypothetical protein